MSSLAAARADNFYYDPLRFDPRVRGRDSANALAGSHPLGDRAKRIKEGILIIRFEMPYDAWCLKCDAHIARGVRFNAEKKRAGMYLSTHILEFSMECPHCGNTFIIRTNPKDADYEYVSGLRKKVKAFSAADAETYEVLDDTERARVRSDAFAQLERVGDDKRKARSEEARLLALRASQDAKWADNYETNKTLRAAARAERAAAAHALAEGARKCLALPLLPARDEDAALAKVVMMERDVGAGSSAAADVPVDGRAAVLLATSAATAAQDDVTHAGAAERMPPLSVSFVRASHASSGVGSALSAPREIAAAGTKRTRSIDDDAATFASTSASASTARTKAEQLAHIQQSVLRKRIHTVVAPHNLVLVPDNGGEAPKATKVAARIVPAAGKNGTASAHKAASRALPNGQNGITTRQAVTSMLDGAFGNASAPARRPR